jgi:hypothetical protein
MIVFLCPQNLKSKPFLSVFLGFTDCGLDVDPVGFWLGLVLRYSSEAAPRLITAVNLATCFFSACQNVGSLVQWEQERAPLHVLLLHHKISITSQIHQFETISVERYVYSGVFCAWGGLKDLFFFSLARFGFEQQQLL